MYRVESMKLAPGAIAAQCTVDWQVTIEEARFLACLKSRGGGTATIYHHTMNPEVWVDGKRQEAS